MPTPPLRVAGQIRIRLIESNTDRAQERPGEAAPKGGVMRLGAGRRSAVLAALAVAAGMVVGVTASPAAAAPSDRARCIQEVAQARLMGPGTNPGRANYVVGTEGDDTFTLTEGVDVVCGFGGNDLIQASEVDGVVVNALEAGDVFLGGAGDDTVFVVRGGVFNGGPGDDAVYVVPGGVFNGGPGDDVVVLLDAGTFNGGPGSDYVSHMSGGVFNGGEGPDVVDDLHGGTFNGGPGEDIVIRRPSFGGTFNQD